MKQRIALLAFALMGSSLSGCMTPGPSHGWADGRSHTYDGWYDDYYGPIYDGYWGLDGFFYFRLDGRDTNYRRDEHKHFRSGDRPDDSRYHRIQGAMRAPPHGAQMPNFPQGDHR